ncbi:MAG: dienelactone hydrolase family protein [Actinomycetota bacterium]
MGEIVSFKANGDQAEGYLAKPSTDVAGAVGVLVVQEWWGLNDQIKGVADRFASEGFVALAPDFFHGRVTKEPDEAGKLLMSLDIDRVAVDARGAAEYLEGLTGKRVGVIGFCMGGALALVAAEAAPDQIGAVVDLYGIHPKVTPDFSKMKAAVLALFAGKDEMVDAGARDAMRAAMKAAGLRCEVDVYPETNHAFMNEMRPEVYNKEAADDAWRRSVEWFRANL